MDFQKESEELLQTLKTYREDAEGWKPAKTTKDVTIWSKQSPAFSGVLYKVEGVINASPQTVFSYVEPNPDSHRPKWDKAIKELQVVQHIDENIGCVRTVTHSALGGLISPRDFVDLTVRDNTDEYYSTIARGIDHPDCAATSSHVRGTNFPCGITAYKVEGEPNKTRLVNFVQSDIGGMLPKSIVEQALPGNIIGFFENLKKALKSDGHLNEDS